MSRPHLQPVPPVDLPDYPIDRETRLDAHSFMKWWHHRWLNSAMHLTGSYEVQGIAFALFNIAQNQSPVGSLPDDHYMLARLLRIDPAHWSDLCARAVGPLHGWTRCLSDGEVRLMHPVVLGQVSDALERREARTLSTEDAAERQRYKRLREGLTKIGVGPAVLDDGVLMGRLDGWLSAQWKGNRTRAAYEAVMVQAGKEGWF